MTNAPWSLEELDAIVVDYFDMLDRETRGIRYVKTEHNRLLRESGVDRSRGSVEMKHRNISAVLLELGMPWIEGYKPAVNYQDAIIEAIGRHLGSTSARKAVDTVPRAYRSLSIVSAPAKRNAVLPRSLERIARRFDPVERDMANRDLGLAGERIVFENERRRLAGIGRDDLSRRVEWSSQERGDGLGYDILSFDRHGEKRFLEVKTTRGGIATPFFMSRGEMGLSEEEPHRFTLCRVHEFGRRGQAMFEAKPPLLASFTGTTETWRMTP